VSLSAEGGLFTLSGGDAGLGLAAEGGLFTLSGGAATMTPGYVVSLGSLELTLNKLPQMAIVGKDGRPSQMFQHDVNKERRAIMDAFNALRDAVTAIQTTFNEAAEARSAASEAANVAMQAQATVATVETTVTGLRTGAVAFEALNVGNGVYRHSGTDLTLEP
jgi:hypothetical protein